VNFKGLVRGVKDINVDQVVTREGGVQQTAIVSSEAAPDIKAAKMSQLTREGSSTTYYGKKAGATGGEKDTEIVEGEIPASV
jgi:hypothetical protein